MLFSTVGTQEKLIFTKATLHNLRWNNPFHLKDTNYLTIMNKIKTITVVLLTLMMVYGCEESTRKEIEDTLNIDTDSDSVITSATQEEKVLEVEQSVDDRILEIKALYAKLQGSPDQNKNCTSNTKMSYDGMEDQYPFENTAKECQLENNFMYQQVYLNGYEWGETCTFYYKEDKRFFTYLTGGAEACGYDYRVYYNREGEVIRVLLAENDCDGEKVSNSIEVTDEKRKQEILSSIAHSEKELNSILKK